MKSGKDSWYLHINTIEALISDQGFLYSFV